MFIRVCGGRKKSEKFVSTEGSVTVTANISGASIKIVTGSKIVATGTAIGNTVTTEKIPAGTYEVIVSKNGFADEKQIVIVDGDVNINVTLVELPIEASAISEITTNTAKVVLAATPARELTAADFKVTGNTVTKIEKGNFDTVYTLTLGTSLDNTKGTLTVNGASKDYDFTQLKINSVKAKNLRQLEVTFSKELNVTGSPAADGTYTKDALLENLHIWMTKEEDGATKTNSIKNIVGTNASNWTAYVLSDKKTVVIESKDGSKLTDTAENTGLKLKLNETYEVEALDVVDASGKFSDVSYMTDILQDTVRPSVKDYDKSVVKDGTLNINFTEPVSELKGANSKAKVYLDGKDVTSSITDVTTNDTVAAHSKISIETTDLDKGEHTFAIVGAEDLNGNVLSDNTKEYTFKITDPADPAEAVTPVVTDIQQIADNAFKVVFNTKFVGVKGADASNNTNVIATIKNGAFNTLEGPNGAYKDIELKKADMKAEDVAATDTTPAHTEWTFVVDATATTSNTDDGKLAYKSANIMNKEIVIDNFATKSGSITSDTDLKFGKETTKSLTFKKDTTAPVISSATDAITSANKVITIKFNDAPFAGNAANIEYTAGKKATVKYVNEEGVTYSEEITPVLGGDNKSIELTVANPDMLSADGSKLIAGGKYSIVLPDAIVKDTEEDSVITTPKYMLLDGQHPFVGTTVNYTVPGAAAVIGSVPQTTRGMIFTGYEAKNSIGTLATSVAGAGKLTLKDNQIVVVFEGEVDSATANNKDNYTLNGKVLPTGTTVEYRQADIVGDTTKEKFVLITLPDNTISLTGGQDFTVQNVANKQGNKMMPVADVITLADNTAPVIKAIEVNASNKITLTFSEDVDIDSSITSDIMNQLGRNFVITANGKTVGLLNAVAAGKKLTITTADNFATSSLDVPVTVQIKKNSDGDIFIADKAGNKAAEMTFTK